MIRRGRVMRFGLLIRDLQLHTAVNDIAFQPIQADDFLIAAAVAEILLGDCPEGVTMVIALWSLALEEEHQERFFSSTYIPTRPSTPMP